jgi:hypothetical protein
MGIRLRPTRTHIASTYEAFPPCHRPLRPELNFLAANSGIHRSGGAIGCFAETRMSMAPDQTISSMSNAENCGLEWGQGQPKVARPRQGPVQRLTDGWLLMSIVSA